MNQLFIGALDLSAYLTQADFDSPVKWSLNCWNVPEELCKGLFANPIIPVPLYVYWQNYNHSSCGDYAGFPTQVTCAEFLFLEYAPYTEINHFFRLQGNRFGIFTIRTRLYLALGEGQ